MQKHRRSRSPGFTLIELLITITVIGIIVAMSAGALMNAQDTAREQRTRSLIAKLHAQMMYRWESYQTRRIPMTSRQVQSNETPQQYAGRRLLAQRQLMRLELPQRWADIVDLSQSPVTPVSATELTESPALSEAYFRRYVNNKVGGVLAPPSDDNETAECFYLIVTMGHDDSLGTKQFRAADVADTDGDGMMEFVDGWRRPISFIRWAPGYLPLKALQPIGKEKQAAFTELQTGDPENDHDPFDPLRLDGPANGGVNRGMRLTPLIYSSGPDGESDIWARSDYTANAAVLFDPYYVPPDGEGLPAGTPMTAENTQNLSVKGEGRHMDNITNHALGVR